MVFLFICCQVAAIRQPDKHHGIYPGASPCSALTAATAGLFRPAPPGLGQPRPAFRIPYSVFRIPYSVFRIPYSVF
jgi:hypothetical protein